MLSQGYVGKLTESQMDMIGVAYKSNERQLEIIEDLLKVAKVDAGKVYLDKSSCDIVVQVEKAIKGQAILFRDRKQNVIFSKPKMQMIASVDSKLILMVIENIIDNAGKYSRDGQDIIVDVYQKDANTIISVKDYGVGIRKRDQKDLFEKFSRIENPLSVSVGGTGLGLYWAKKILDLHEGSIEVISTLKGGSTFKITTPTTSDVMR